MFLYVVFRLLLAILVRIQINTIIWIITKVTTILRCLSSVISSRSSLFSKTNEFRKPFTNNNPQRGIIIVCKLPLADRYRPRIAPYVGIYNACLVERVLTESMVNLVKNYQKRIGPKLKVSLNLFFRKITYERIKLKINEINEN